MNSGSSDNGNELRAVFTWLHRLEPPGPMPHPPLTGQLALMRVEFMPIGFYRFLLDSVGGRYHWVQRMRLDNEVVRSLLDAKTTEIFVLYLQGAPAGFFEIDRRREGTAHIVHFGLMAHAQGRHLSGWFLHAALDAAWREDTERITIGTTSLDHPAALRLYQRFGFTVTERSQGTIRPLARNERIDRLLAD